ncbi:MAG: superoxide dismutase, partial [Caulobacteraceae bacterium]
PELPYAYDALEPTISERTLRFHHDKHHAGYVRALNDLLAKTGEEESSLEELIRVSAQGGPSKLFNNAAQAWNHSFFWNAMSPGADLPNGDLGAAVERDFGAIDDMKSRFVEEGAAHFGSGWVWLAADPEGVLTIAATHDAHDMVTEDAATPLLVCDLWEHAYYLDYQNDRRRYLEAWFDALPDWEFAERQFAAARQRAEGWTHPAG